LHNFKENRIICAVGGYTLVGFIFFSVTFLKNNFLDCFMMDEIASCDSVFSLFFWEHGSSDKNCLY